MKKLLVIAMCVMLSISMFAACGEKDKQSEASTASQTQSTSKTEDASAATTGGYTAQDYINEALGKEAIDSMNEALGDMMQIEVSTEGEKTVVMNYILADEYADGSTESNL